ncbi:MAG: hypothetical protein ACYC1Q_00720 [Bacteroidia bacterium]
MKKTTNSMLFLFFGLVMLFSCAPKKGDGEFYGQITYKVTVGGAVEGSTLLALQKMFGDSIEVSFTDKGYRLIVYKDTLVHEWYENETGTIYFMMDGVDSLYYEKATENSQLLTHNRREETHRHLGRNCNTYFLQDDRFHIEMWYDSSMYISPKRFSRLYQGHYNTYYADCRAPYLVRSLVMPPVNIRIEAIRIETAAIPDPDWSEKPDFPLVPFGE